MVANGVDETTSDDYTAAEINCREHTVKFSHKVHILWTQLRLKLIDLVAMQNIIALMIACLRIIALTCGQPRVLRNRRHLLNCVSPLVIPADVFVHGPAVESDAQQRHEPSATLTAIAGLSSRLGNLAYVHENVRKLVKSGIITVIVATVTASPEDETVLQ